MRPAKSAPRVLPLLLALLCCAAAAQAQPGIAGRIRSGIEGVARGLDEVGRRADDLLGPSLRLGEDGAATHTERRTFEERYPTGPAPVVSITNSFGEIRVDTWNERVVQVTAEISVGADSPETAAQVAGAISVNAAAGEDVVEIKTLLPETRGDQGRITIAVNYRVTLPKDASLVADNFFGDVFVSGAGGLVGVEAQYGAVEIRQAGGAVRVRTQGEFPVVADGLAQGGVFQMDGARAELSNVAGELRVASFRGSLRITRPAPNLNANLTVDSGRAELLFPADADPDLTIAVLHGALKSDLDLSRSGQEDRIIARRPKPGASQQITLNASFSDVAVSLQNGGPAPAKAADSGSMFNEVTARRFTPQPGAVLGVEAVTGNVRVEGVDGAELEVSATRIVWVPNASAAVSALGALELRAQEDPGRLTLHTVADADMARFGCDSWRVDLLVRAPRGMPLRINAAGGNVSVSGMNGEVTVNQEKGELAVDNLDGPAVLSNRQGTVRAGDCTAGVEVSARYGDITLTRVSGKISAQNLEGRTIVETPRGDVQVRNSGGDIRLLSLEPLMGNLDLRAEKAGISLLLTPETSATLTLRAGQGRVQSSLPLTGVIGGDQQEFTGRLNDGRFTVLLETDGGDIVLN